MMRHRPNQADISGKRLWVPDVPELTRRANFFETTSPADSVSEGM
jgi:hypothetical protein